MSYVSQMMQRRGQQILPLEYVNDGNQDALQQQPYNPYDVGVQRAIKNSHDSLGLRPTSVLDVINQGATGFSKGLEGHQQMWGESNGRYNLRGLLSGLSEGLMEMHRGQKKDEDSKLQMMLIKRELQEKERQYLLKEQRQIQKDLERTQEKEFRRQERLENREQRQADRQEAMAFRRHEAEMRQERYDLKRQDLEEKSKEKYAANLLNTFNKEHQKELKAASIAQAALADLDTAENALNDTSWTDFGKRILPSEGDKNLEYALRALKNKNTELGRIKPDGGLIPPSVSNSKKQNRELINKERERLQALADREQQIMEKKERLESGKEPLVNVIDPDGNMGTVLKSELSEYLAKGFKLTGDI